MADVRAAEKLLEEAVARRDALSEPDNWDATEALDPEGRRSVHFRSGHFGLLEHANASVKRAHDRVLAVRRSWAGLSLDGRAAL
jgi:hypothetical protein